MSFICFSFYLTAIWERNLFLKILRNLSTDSQCDLGVDAIETQSPPSSFQFSHIMVGSVNMPKSVLFLFCSRQEEGWFVNLSFSKPARFSLPQAGTLLGYLDHIKLSDIFCLLRPLQLYCNPNTHRVISISLRHSSQAPATYDLKPPPKMWNFKALNQTTNARIQRCSIKPM